MADTEKNPSTPAKRRRLTGTVVSAAMQKTVVVRVDRMQMHPVYKKRYRVSKKFHAHAVTPFAVGEKVVIEETRPLSRTKRWRVIEKVA